MFAITLFFKFIYLFFDISPLCYVNIPNHGETVMLPQLMSGVGHVATGVDVQNNPLIEVMCPVLTPLVDQLTAAEISVPLPASTGTSDIPIAPSTIKLCSTIPCTFMGVGHVRSVPDVVHGERVMVFHYAGDEMYYWMPILKTHVLRETEHVRIAVHDKQHNGEGSDDESFFIEIDSKHHRGIRLRTGQGRGEAVGYLWEIDPDASVFVLKDTLGNIITVDSKARLISLVNADGTTIALDKKLVTVTAAGNVTVTTDASANVSAADVTVSSSGGITLDEFHGVSFIETRSGSIVAQDMRVTGNVSFTASTGNIDVSFRNAPADLRFDLHSTSGSISMMNEDYYRLSSGPAARFAVYGESVSGNQTYR